MQNIVGIFGSRIAAEQAVRGLLARGISQESIIFLTGEAGSTQVEKLPTTDAESDGMGEAVGAVVGGAVGAGAGLSRGSAVASLLVPGVGTIFAVGLGAAAVLVLSVAVAGATVGVEFELAMYIGVLVDVLFVYRQLMN